MRRSSYAVLGQAHAESDSIAMVLPVKTGSGCQCTCYSGLLLSYSLLISAMAALLASRHGESNRVLSILYGVSSFYITAPFHYEYLDESIQLLSRYRHRETALSLRVSIVLGYALASLTTFAGVALAYDAIDQPLRFLDRIHDGLAAPVKYFFVMLFSLAVWSSRGKGATHFIHNLYQRHAALPCYRPVVSVQLLVADMRRYYDRFPVTPAGGNRPVFFSISHFYQTLAAEQCPLRWTPAEYGAKWGERCAVAVLLCCSFLLMPMWLSLTENGMSKISEPLSGVDVLVWLSALSSVFFYCISSVTYCDQVKRPLRALYYRHGSAMSRQEHWKWGGLLVFTGVCAWFSGAGFNQEMRDHQRNHFGRVGGEFMRWAWCSGLFQLAQSWLPWIANVMAGVVVNGRSVCLFYPKKIAVLADDRWEQVECVTQQLRLKAQDGAEASRLAEHIVYARSHWVRSQMSPLAPGPSDALSTRAPC